MVKIVGIGANVYDTLITVSSFPKEDTKKRAEKIEACGGGPCATALVTAHKLGENAAFIGNIAGDAAGVFLKEDMEKRGMSSDFIDIKKGFSSFSSYVLLNEETASRTCVFHRGNVPPLALSENQKKAIENAEILMVDGNELDAAIEGAMIAKNKGTKVLYDAGGLYDGIEKLMPFVDILIPSEEFALRFTGEENAESAAKKFYEMYHPEVVCITCGKKGGIIFEGGKAKSYKAFPVDAVDTNGAGDVFHGAFAFSVIKGYSYENSAIFSSAVSAIKCTKVGARDSIPTFRETINFLKGRGIDEFEKNME